ncbi:MAG TPA: hypothetical protein VG734_00460 [Lacunisphaera sp.]|nr:hypothetical protein [Lacunisphaera sp.]
MARIRRRSIEFRAIALDTPSLRATPLEGNNILASVVLKRRFLGMTIGIGIICRDGIVMASDSRTEDEESGAKRFDMAKIVVVSEGPIKCVISRAGATTLSGAAIRLLKEKLSKTETKSRHEILALIQQSVGEVRAGFKIANPNADYFSPFGRFSLLIAIHDATPALYVIKSHEYWAGEELPSPAYVGSGEGLAHYILGGVDYSSVSMEEATYAATYAVEVAKMKHSQCEGPTRAAFITKDFAILPQQNELDKVALECANFEKQNDTEWIAKLTDWVRTKRI